MDMKKQWFKWQSGMERWVLNDKLGKKDKRKKD